MSVRQTWGYPEKHGLYDPAYEKDSCGVGIVAHIKGQRSHQLVLDADHVLRRMAHRGACGCEATTGDGAGMLTALPHEFLAKVAQVDLRAELPEPGKYGAGLVFLPTMDAEREKCKRVVERIIAEQGQRLVGWRRVPVRGAEADLGPSASAAQPAIEQLFVAAEGGLEGDAFERQLYVIRKRASHSLRGDRRLKQAAMFYICSLSTKVIIYKGMLMADQLMLFYPDLADDSYLTHLAMVHSRFSTNTFPSWDRAQPLRFMSHNGEINTLQGNLNWMRAREGVVAGGLFGDDLPKLFPLAEPGCSDSGSFDNVLEFLLMSGRSLQEAIMMMIPEAWQKHDTMPENKRAFYEYHSAVMEPWDGPASITFTDGRYIGAVLDRNGLRPSRYYLTHDDRVIMASEVGVLAVDPQNIKAKGRLQPGRMFLVDFEQGRLIPDEELKNDFASRRPYAQWLRENRIELKDLPRRETAARFDPETLLQRLQAFGYTIETMQFMLLPLVQQKRDPVGSMGNDSALACLSDQPRLVYDYFKQLFAQVTNPPIDSIREEVIMSLECYIGPERNLLETTEEHCQRLLVPHPILTNEDLAALQEMDHRGWRTRTIDITFPLSAGPDGMRDAILRICAEAEAAIDEGYSLVVLSDRAMSAERVPVSSLLACGAVHHHLVRQAKRTRIGLVLETGEAREVHHHCLLVGYGADAINPYLAFEALWQARADGLLDAAEFPDDAKVVSAYRMGVAKGILKVMAKMGISTLQSYKGAQIFEAVGLNREVIDLCFVGTASRIQGVGLKTLAEETLRRHALGYPDAGRRPAAAAAQSRRVPLAGGGRAARLEPGRDHQFAGRGADGRPRCLLAVRQALERGRPRPLYVARPAAVQARSPRRSGAAGRSRAGRGHRQTVLHGRDELRLDFRRGAREPGRRHESHRRTQQHRRRRRRSGALQAAAQRRFETLGHQASRLGPVRRNRLVLDQRRRIADQDGPRREARRGRRVAGRKVDENIARIRYATPGVGLISPPPHHDIYSIEDLAQLIYDLKNANPSARISVKLVSEVGVGTVAAGVAKAHAEHITVSGDSGGTGASPLTSIKHAGLPWELGIAEAHQTLVLNDLRSRVVLQTDGGIRTGRDVVIAALLGAEEMGFATAPLITLGCVMMRKCHLNTCPVGVATQDPVLRRKFTGKPEHVINYLFMVAEEARQIMAQLGFRKMDDMIGRVDCLEPEDAIRHWKTDGLDLRPILAFARRPHDLVAVRRTIPQDHRLDRALDNTHLLKLTARGLIRGEAVKVTLPILNTHRTVGTILSHEVVKKWGEKGLPDDTIHIKFTGSAGQSFGAFLAGGITLELEGDANDYTGKGLSGGKLIVYPPAESTFAAEDNILVGNVVLYGATDGRAFFRGRAAERFCVRNSGAWAVIEGVGDHGCEYMTGGRAIILGPTGRNFAAGMSGGVAYVWDAAGDFATKCNLGTVELERVEAEEDIGELLEMIEMHQTYTGSRVAERVLDEWMTIIREQFVKVMPIDYKRVLMDRRAHEEEEETPVREEFAAR